MSDPRFARLKTDPRFRRIRKKDSKVVVDERFKGIFDGGKKKKGNKGRVDKYGRQLTDTHEQDNLRRFYRLEGEDEQEPEVKIPDYARGAVLLESSDSEDEEDVAKDDDSDNGGIISLGRDISKPIPIPEDEVEIDLDEDNFADLDAQAAALAESQAEEEALEIEPTRRLAVVNLDWDHVRAIHLHKIFSSMVSPTAPVLPSSSKASNFKDRAGTISVIARGRVLSVRVYASQFGKERMAREETEGPPPEVFKKKVDEDEEVNERNIYETGEGEDYDEDALRQYQLERLRYYYAVVECDTVEAASHLFSELEGTELERSANVFDLSFVPDDMTFDDDPRDEATDDLNVPYRGLEFVTDALRHSKVKLTWDEDDPERIQITRRVLSRKELEENDFKAYIASSESESEDEGRKKDRADREKLRALLLSGGDDTLPEGWGDSKGDKGDVDMEITFNPGLSGAIDDKDETTLEKYQRKMREKKKKRKEERKGKVDEDEKPKKSDGLDDDFFGGSSDDEAENEDKEESAPGPSAKRGKDAKSKGKKKQPSAEPEARTISTAEELALIAASDNPAGEVEHFDMKAVIKSEKLKGRKMKGKKKKRLEQENELQEDFSVDVQDDRFKALHEDHAFAIDPSNPRFKKTKGMAALLDERSKRQKQHTSEGVERTTSKRSAEDEPKSSLKSLVESVKRKSAAADQPGMGKRRRL